MKTFLSLVATIIIILNLIAPFSEGGKTFEEAVPAESALTVLADHPRFLIESCTLAYLMLHLGKEKYLPFRNRKHAVLHAGRGSGNTITGLISFFRLQRELITLQAKGFDFQPFTKVTIILSREEHVNDVNKVPPKAGDESDQVKMDRLNGILGELHTLMKSNSCGYELVEESLPAAAKSVNDIKTELLTQFNTMKAKFNPDEIAMSMDIAMGSGVRGRKTGEKALLNLMLSKYLADNKVPAVLHDGRSCAGNDGFVPYEFGKDAVVYGVHTGRVIGSQVVQGLIVTDLTKGTALVGYQQTQEVDNAILVAHGTVSAADLPVLQLAMNSPTGNMENAFDAVVVTNYGYYKK